VGHHGSTPIATATETKVPLAVARRFGMTPVGSFKEPTRSAAHTLGMSDSLEVIFSVREGELRTDTAQRWLP